MYSDYVVRCKGPKALRFLPSELRPDRQAIIRKKHHSGGIQGLPVCSRDRTCFDNGVSVRYSYIVKKRRGRASESEHRVRSLQSSFYAGNSLKISNEQGERRAPSITTCMTSKISVSVAEGAARETRMTDKIDTKKVAEPNKLLPSQLDELREKALNRLENAFDEIAARISVPDQGDVAKLLNELRVQQIELEIQNEQLRQTQIELAESRDEFFDLYETAPVGYLTVTAQGMIQKANLTLTSLLRTGKNNLLSRPLPKFIATKDQGTFYACLQNALRSQMKCVCELRMGQPNEDFFDAHVEIVPKLDQGDDMESCRVVIIDITSRKQAEEALKRAQAELERKVEERTRDLFQSRQRLASALEGADLGMWAIDLRTEALFSDERLRGILGYSNHEISASFRDWVALCHPDDMSAMRNAFRRHLKGESAVYESEHRIRAKDDTWKWLLVRGKVVEWDERGQPMKMAGTGLDITARKQAQGALAESEERFRTIIESVPHLIWIKDIHGTVTHVNRAVSDLHNMPVSAIIGRTVNDLFDPQVAHQINEIDRRVLEGEAIEMEHARSIEGSLRTFLDIRVPLYDRERRIVGLAVVSRDITDRKRLLAVPDTRMEDYPSAATKRMLEQARQFASEKSTVLLLGESGSGKDWLARWIHDHSPRAANSFFAVNCASIPAELAESELFGHEKGAFTGAVTRKRGLLELSEGGTLLLNEIGELPLSLQSKLLVFLDTKEFLRLGGERPVRVNARLIAATHRDLKKEISEERFLPPLYYRLSVLSIEIPPLRERIEDIPVLVQQLISEFSAQLSSPAIGAIDPGELELLSRYNYPGNVRELRNLVERSLILSRGDRLELRPPTHSIRVPDSYPCVYIRPDQTIAEAKDELMKTMCEDALRRAGGNKKAAADSLGVSRDAFYRYLRQYEIIV